MEYQELAGEIRFLLVKANEKLSELDHAIEWAAQKIRGTNGSC